MNVGVTGRVLNKRIVSSVFRNTQRLGKSRNMGGIIGAFLKGGQVKKQGVKPIGKSMSVPKSVNEFISRLKSPSVDSSVSQKLNYQNILMSLMAKKYPDAVYIIPKDATIPRIEGKPPEVVFKKGSNFNEKGTTDIVEHVKGDKTSQFMGTTFANNSKIDGDYLYHLTPVEAVGINVSNVLEYYNLTHPKWQKIPWVENEIAIGRFQLPQQYKSVQKILERHEDNSIKKLGEVIENPKWKNKVSLPIEKDMKKLWEFAKKNGLVI